MRILIVTNNYTPYSGGVVSSLKALVPELQRTGHEVLLVAPQFLSVHPDDPSVHPDDPAWVFRIPALIRFTWHNNSMALPWRMKHNLSEIMHSFKPDVVHVQHPFLLGAVAAQVAYSQGIPVVFTYHTMYEAYAHYVPLPQPWVKRFIVWYVRRFCNRVTTIIAPGNTVRQLLIDRGVTTPIVVIPSPLQEVFLKSRQRHEHQQRGSQLKNLSDTRCVLLTVGRFVVEKNMHAVLDLYAGLPREQFRLVLIGYGVLYEQLQEYAYTTLGLSPDDVQFLHKPSQEIIAQWYADADLFIFTSQIDTQGLVLVEAMAGGLPVVALPGPGQQEVIVDGVNGFICPSLDVMGKQLRDLVPSAEQSETDQISEQSPSVDQMNLLRAGARNTAERYRPEILAAKVIDVYKQAIRS